MRDQAKVIQNTLSQEKITVDKRGVRVVINGNLEIVSINIESDIPRDNIEDNIKYCLNEAIKEIQKVMATKMRGMGDISSMLKF